MSDERVAHATAAPNLPAPARSVYEDRKPPWISVDFSLEHIA